jgi:hypothetical protein
VLHLCHTTTTVFFLFYCFHFSIFIFVPQASFRPFIFFIVSYLHHRLLGLSVFPLRRQINFFLYFFLFFPFPPVIASTMCDTVVDFWRLLRTAVKKHHTNVDADLIRFVEETIADENVFSDTDKALLLYRFLVKKTIVPAPPPPPPTAATVSAAATEDPGEEDPDATDRWNDSVREALFDDACHHDLLSTSPQSITKRRRVN